MELILVRNYPGMPFHFFVRRVVMHNGVPGFVKRGRWYELAEALYAVSITTLLKIGH